LAISPREFDSQRFRLRALVVSHGSQLLGFDCLDYSKLGLCNSIAWDLSSQNSRTDVRNPFTTLWSSFWAISSDYSVKYTLFQTRDVRDERASSNMTADKTNETCSVNKFRRARMYRCLFALSVHL
jgi:hypothetical protein